MRDSSDAGHVTLAISLSALIFSMFVFVHNRRGNRRELLLKVHEQLLDSDRQRGRRTLFEMGEKGQAPDDLASEEFVAVNHALASLDMLGYLFYRRLVPRSDVVALWGATAMRACRVAEATGMLAMRDAQNLMPVWPYLRYLAAWMDSHKDRAARIPSAAWLPVSSGQAEDGPSTAD
jgi:hypothetical protein